MRGQRLVIGLVAAATVLAGCGGHRPPAVPPAPPPARPATPPATPPQPAPPVAPRPATPLRPPDVIFVPTRDPVIEAMLQMAGVTKNDVVYDLGCGDGRIVIAAARLGARAVGIDIDPERIAEANERARQAGVTDRVQFILGDIFDPAIPIREATVVTLYLLPQLNLKLRPRLWSELRPGTRVVSNSFSMGDWVPERTDTVGSYTVYLWRIAARDPGSAPDR